jgi:hypothetical protein
VGEKLRNKRNKIGEDFYPFLRRSIVVELVTAGIISSKFLQEKVTGLFLFWGIGRKRGGKLIKAGWISLLLTENCFCCDCF